MKKRALLALGLSCLLVYGCGDESSGSGAGTHQKPGGDITDTESECGNGVIEDGELCDDGNDEDGDGCSADCRTIESGYSCPNEGVACQKTGSGPEPQDPPVSKCGNGWLESGEACDDSNTNDNDGCSADCTRIEAGYSCPTEGYACKPEGCGNMVVEENEACDDGPDESLDYTITDLRICSPSCQFAHFCGDGKVDRVDIDNGEECDGAGVDTSSEYNGCTKRCKLSFHCGDGQITHNEVCDDGNSVSGDGCSADCKLEIGYSCKVPGMPCDPPKCGNGTLDDGELCDDGNRDAGDGCSPICVLETGYVCPKDAACRPVKCNDGIVEGTESCEDGNEVDGDGCSALCQIEPGWLCPDGHKCQVVGCGDGVVAGDEECDDGNNTNNDGCSQFCARESGFACPPRGGDCYTTTCGDGIVEGDETCDEGVNKTAGCSADCQITMGWECLNPGSKCTQTATFGNGILEGAEQCDEGTANKTDGCNDGIIAEGWRCPTPGSSCIHGKCGDGKLDKGEFCDDGNYLAGDGCNTVCEKESMFTCSADGSCKPVCGDGITVWEAGELCDDGNTLSGDGCSANCTIEEGFACTEHKSASPETILLPVVYRDFRAYSNGSSVCSAATSANPIDGCIDESHVRLYGSHFSAQKGHPDFQNMNITETGLVDTKLGADGLPVLVKIPNDNTMTTESFNMWYRDYPGINKTFKENLELKRINGETGTYQFTSGDFFPLNNRGYGNEMEGYGEQNFHFTTHIQTYFKYRGNAETLSFEGDDDVWVFVNGIQAIDLGGCHGSKPDSFTLSANVYPDAPSGTNIKYDPKYKLYEGGIYSISFFHAERFVDKSNFTLTLAGFLDMGPSACEAICGDGLVRGDEECDPVAFADPANPTPAEREQAARLGCEKCLVKPYCGNNKREGFEECDGEDWCQLGCKYDSNCGNGVKEGHEQCDEGNRNGKEGSTCQINCTTIGCGNGILETGEECDDGNRIDDDNCSNACKRPFCGDGVVQEWLGEVCDDGKNDGSYNGCGLGCAYLPPRCGDAIIDSMNHEDCDLGAVSNIGAYGTCNTDCSLAPRCGDGITQHEFEACDDGDDNGKPGKCSTTCKVEVN